MEQQGAGNEEEDRYSPKIEERIALLPEPDMGNKSLTITAADIIHRVEL